MFAYLAIGGAVLVFARSGAPVEVEKLVEVSFEKTLPKKDLPPPPPAAKRPPPKKLAKAIAPPPMKELIQPKEVPKEAPPEADPSRVVATGDGTGDPYGTTGGVPGGTAAVEPPAPPPPPPKPKRLEPINLPEEAIAPEPDPSNPIPGYPEAARSAGIEGKVILKLAISETGQVINVQVLRGDPLLAEAAVKVVKLWKFTPAMLDGRPISVFRILPLSFSSKVGGG